MPDVLWELPAPGSAGAPEVERSQSGQLPDGARKVVDSVAAGGAQGMFPPVVTDGPEGTVVVLRHLSGAAEAEALADALTDACFAPLTAAMERLDTWCLWAAPRWAGLIAPRVLDVAHGELFGPLSTEIFEACVTWSKRRAADFAALRVAQFQHFLDLFLTRLDRDLAAGLPDVPGLDGPVSGIWAHGDETHNGGGRVLRVEFAGGGRLAYKPRPASGEVLFLAEGADGADEADGGPAGSVFALLNSLPMASGPVRLPVLRCRMGQGPGGADYSWHEWIDPPGTIGVLRAGQELALRGTVLEPAAARRFWHRAGALAAAGFAFGIADLIGPNLQAGTRPGDDEPLLYPVDLEVYFTDSDRLSATGLVQDPAGGPHHVGLESVPRWCDLDGPPTCWTTGSDGTLRLVRRTRPLARTWTRSVVADTEGRVGYGPYLDAMLRGMFDAWTLMCRNRERIAAFVAERAPHHVVRVLARPTREYADALTADRDDAAAVFAPDERVQLTRGDVPYFFRTAVGGPLQALPEPGGPAVQAELPDSTGWTPTAVVREGRRLDLARLGHALRGAVEHVFADLAGPDVCLHGDGVRITLHGSHHGEVSFDWVGTGRRITYAWDETKLRLRIDEMGETDGPGGPGGSDADTARTPDGIRERLLRLGRVDAALRTLWAAGGFADAELEEKLGRLTATAATWLDGVIAEHGWPGQRLVGPEASAVASGLVQHVVARTDFQRRCLRLVEAAAADGDVPLREVAYLTDALRWQEGREQVYGTKFRKVAGELVPCPIEDASRVDARRAGVGLGPLDEYAARLRERFANTDGVSA
ncbi:DUF4135 domain-containing protein [Streptomyces sp. NPDC056084]|uniref:DUF4135 domain-containing protein n=1 Tax=unclassified Streptomyces TaxID=2593676 RepID=UPI0035DE6F4D